MNKKSNFIWIALIFNEKLEFLKHDLTSSSRGKEVFENLDFRIKLVREDIKYLDQGCL